ncbi:MAG: SpvB/TcaC N-terminal domain-containing protein, partial [Myxococcota bacterium]
MRRRALALWLICLTVQPTDAAAVTDNSTPVNARGATGLVDPSSGIASNSTQPFTGESTFALPIVVPQGTGGMSPSLALSYSSGNSSDSWVGYGWSLGIGSVQRSSKNGVPKYDDDLDTFVLDGQELIPDGAVTDRYHTRRETFLRIDRLVDGSWEVRSPDGTVSRYGMTANARVGRGASETFAWFLSERVDLHGNGFRALYDELDPGNRHPVEIRYGLRTGSSGLESLNPGNPDSVDRVIRFVLEARPDRRVHHSGRFAQELNRRLRDVEVTVGGSLIRRYHLDYGAQSQDSRRSLLRAVLEFGADNGALQPPRTTSFAYSSNVDSGRAGWASVDPDDPEIPASEFYLPSGLFFTRTDNRDGGTRLAELNGDGFIDAIREVKINGAVENDAQSGAYLNSPSGFSDTPEPNYRLPFVVNGPHRQAFQNVSSGVPLDSGLLLTDLDRDGRADVLGLQYFFYSVSPASAFRAQDLYRNTGTGWASVLSSQNGDTLGHGSNNFAFRDAYAQITDGGTQLTELNGDGKPDLLTRDYLTFTTVYQPIVARGYSFALEASYGFTPGQSDRYNVCTDNTDVCLLNSVMTRRDILPVPVGGTVYVRQVQVIRAGKRQIDVNGDGLDDHVTAFFTEDSGLPQQDFTNTYLNNGDDFVLDDRWVVPVRFDREEASGTVSHDQGVRVADLNGDGIVDLVRAFGGIRGVWLGTGNPLSPWWSCPDYVDTFALSGTSLS